MKREDRKYIMNVFIRNLCESIMKENTRTGTHNPTGEGNERCFKATKYNLKISLLSKAV